MKEWPEGVYDMMQGWVNLGDESGGIECTIFILQEVILILFSENQWNKSFAFHKNEFYAMKNTRLAIQNVMSIKPSHPIRLSHQVHFQLSHGSRSYLDFDL